MSSDTPLGDDSTRVPLSTVPVACYDVLGNPRRIRILEILGSAENSVSVAELTVKLLARDPQLGSTEPTEDQLRLDLVHNQLPRLADAGIVEWGVDSGVELADSFPIEPAELTTLLESCQSENMKTALETVVHPVRLPLCSLLAETDRPQTLDSLADRLAMAAIVTDADRAAIELHHSHLPALTEAGLLTYDSDDRLVRGTSHSLPAIVS